MDRSKKAPVRRSGSTRECVLSHFSGIRLCDPMDCSPPGFSVHGILQARMGVGCHFLLQEIFSPYPGIELASIRSPALAGRFFTDSATWKAQTRAGKNNPDGGTAVQGSRDEWGMTNTEKPRVRGGEHLENALQGTSQMQLKLKSSQAVRDLGFYSKARGNHQRFGTQAELDQSAFLTDSEVLAARGHAWRPAGSLNH